jgi:hypothetical protein
VSLALERSGKDGGRIAVAKAHVVAISPSLNSLHRIRVLWLQVASSDAPVVSERRNCIWRVDDAIPMADFWQTSFKRNIASMRQWLHHWLGIRAQLPQLQIRHDVPIN